MANRDQEMVDGVAQIVRRVKDKANRREIVDYVMRDFKSENVKVDKDKFMRKVGLGKSNGQIKTK